MNDYCKTLVNLNFSEKWQNGKLLLVYKLQNLNFYRSHMMKWTSLLHSKTVGFSRFSGRRCLMDLKNRIFEKKNLENGK